jgi:coenzyme F420-reducing hydrogenase beta subunit
MQGDKEGFAYPVVNNKGCSNCGLCVKVCPVINQQFVQQAIATYAATNYNQATRRESSSGGIFTLLAEETINKGGVVFGVAFNEEWQVEHICVDKINDIKRLRGSKYVQSNIGNSYTVAEKFLKLGKEVLFSGTPCQIAGLKRFLRKEYKNLRTVDFVCHGVPSPKVWKKYLDEVCRANNIGNITDIQFRNKAEGWKKYSLQITYTGNDGKERIFRETLNDNIFMKCFLSNLCLRPSCYQCPTRCGKSGSDITLGDLWGAERICPEIDDDKGLSLVMLRKECELPQCDRTAISYNEALEHNPSIERNVREPKRRKKFFRKVRRLGVCKSTIQCTTQEKRILIWDKILWNIKNRILK